jgi:hypothetical protein
MNAILQEAARVKLPSKDAIEKILSGYVREEKTELTQTDLAKVYAFFLAGSKTAKTDPEKWVAQAVAGNKDIRPYLHRVYSDGSRLIGCDGNRLHWIETDRPKGYYDSKTLLADDTCNIRYPDIDRIIPDKSKCEQVEATIADLPIDSATLNGKLTPCYQLPNGALIHKTQLDQAANGCKSVSLYYSDRLNPVLIESLDGTRHAVVITGVRN